MEIPGTCIRCGKGRFITVAEDRKVYRSPARAANPGPAQGAPRPQAGGSPPQRPGGTPPRRRKRRRSAAWRRSRLVLALCLLCLFVVVLVSVLLTRCSAGAAGPARADFGTTAAAWQKNELGY